MYLKNKTKYRLTEGGRRYPIFFDYIVYLLVIKQKKTLGQPWQKLLNIIANYDLAYK